MLVEDGQWIMQGIDWEDPDCIHSAEELEEYVEQVGFLPLFSNGVKGFSVEEWTESTYWWSGVPDVDPWAWREIVARNKKVAYGKFFDKKAGFISLKWLPYFVNARRSGYDFDAAWDDGKVEYREKKIMDFYMDEDEDGEIIWKDVDLISTDLKKAAGFGKGKEKNYPGVMTNLQMKMYLVISDFRRRKNKKGSEYGMPVSIPLPPEKIWGYDMVTSAYSEPVGKSWHRIYDHIKESYVNASDEDIIKIIGKEPLGD